MSIAKKFFSTLGVLVIASSVLPSTTANAQSVGVVTASGSNMVFCANPATATSQGTATTTNTSAVLGSSYNFQDGTSTFYLARNSNAVGSSPTVIPGLTDGTAAGVSANRCLSTITVTMSNPTIRSGHTTRFEVNNSANIITVRSVSQSNTAPTFNTTSLCIAPNSRATFRINDAENDSRTITVVGGISNALSTVSSSTLDITPNLDFVGNISFDTDAQDAVMIAGNALVSTVAVNGTGLTAGTSDATFAIDPSGTNAVRTRLNVQVSNSCPSSSSSMMSSSMMSSSMMSSSMMSSSMMSSSMMSSDSSSSMKSSMMSSAPVVVYIEVPVSGKGMTIRTGANS